ncbi:MAG: Crp/Fnr family transcriptional regulator [Deltaproteobacteria bacterium]|nr:Crp/Fnr family transcriptional regulator [Deltaproteobacteria bacterium]
METNRLELLKRTPLFADPKLEPAALEQLAAALDARSYPARARIFSEGDPAAAMFVVAKGRVGIFKASGDARVLLAEIGPGACFGELALVDGGMRSADADALDDVDLLELEARELDDLLDRFPRLALCLLRATSKRLRSAGMQVAEEAKDEAADDPIASSYPHPIAAVWRNLSVLVDPRPRLERFFDLLEVTTRYLGIVGVGVYLRGDRTVELVDDAIAAGLTRISLGQWLTLVSSCVQPFDADPGASWMPALHGFCWSRPGRRTDVMGEMQALVQFRNEQRHGASGALSERDIEKHLAVQLPRLRTVLDSLAFLAEHPLVWLERMDYQGGKFVNRCQRCMGSHADFESETFRATVPAETGHLYLRKPGTDDAGLVSLHPMLHLDTCSVCSAREIFFLVAVPGKSLEYAEFTRGHHHATEATAQALGVLRAGARDRLRRAETDG